MRRHSVSPPEGKLEVYTWLRTVEKPMKIYTKRDSYVPRYSSPSKEQTEGTVKLTVLQCAI